MSILKTKFNTGTHTMLFHLWCGSSVFVSFASRPDWIANPKSMIMRRISQPIGYSCCLSVGFDRWNRTTYNIFTSRNLQIIKYCSPWNKPTSGVRILCRKINIRHVIHTKSPALFCFLQSTANKVSYCPCARRLLSTAKICVIRMRIWRGNWMHSAA